MPELKLAPGAFVVWSKSAARLGVATNPSVVFELDPRVMMVLSCFAEPREPDEVFEQFGVEGPVRDKFAALLKKLEAEGLLTTATADARPREDPGLLKDTEFELGRVSDLHPDIRALDPGFMAMQQACQPFTLTSVPLMYALYSATRYLVGARIEGDFVECGVWRGGSMMLAAMALKALGATERRLFLYDTFDWSFEQASAHDGFIQADGSTGNRAAVEAPAGGALAAGVSMEEVCRNLASTGYPPEKLVPVRGLVQETIPGQVPERIALLRLDTDFYESTLHELEHLFPRLAPGGVLLLDDYGKLSGATRAVDEYFARQGIHMLLNRVDIQGRIGIKR